MFKSSIYSILSAGARRKARLANLVGRGRGERLARVDNATRAAAARDPQRSCQRCHFHCVFRPGTVTYLSIATAAGLNMRASRVAVDLENCGLRGALHDRRPIRARLHQQLPVEL